MMLPAKIKNGMASSENTEIPEKMRCEAVSTATSKGIIGKIAHTEEIPRAMAIGTPKSSITTKRTRIIKPDNKEIVILVHVPFLFDTAVHV